MGIRLGIIALLVRDLLQLESLCCVLQQSKEAKIRNRYNQVPHLTQDTTQESDKNTIKHYTQESQVVSPFPAGDHKVAMDKTL